MNSAIPTMVRLQKPLRVRIMRFVKQDGSTISQFVRTAVLKEIRSREKGAA